MQSTSCNQERDMLGCALAAVVLAACGWEMVSVQEVSWSLSTAVTPWSATKGGNGRAATHGEQGDKTAVEQECMEQACINEEQAVLVCILDQRSCGVSPLSLWWRMG